LDPWYWRSLDHVIKVISRKLDQKKNFQESNLWPHVFLTATLTLIFYARNLQIKVYNNVQRYTVLMHTIMSYWLLSTNKCVNSSMMRGQSQFMNVINLRLFLELDVVFQYCQISTISIIVILIMAIRKYGTYFPTFKKILTVTKFVACSSIIVLYHKNQWQELKETDYWETCVTARD
jgi:hypothetical protein